MKAIVILLLKITKLWNMCEVRELYAADGSNNVVALKWGIQKVVVEAVKKHFLQTSLIERCCFPFEVKHHVHPFFSSTFAESFSQRIILSRSLRSFFYTSTAKRRSTSPAASWMKETDITCCETVHLAVTCQGEADNVWFDDASSLEARTTSIKFQYQRCCEKRNGKVNAYICKYWPRI